MFAEMRRSDRLLSPEETIAILQRCDHGVLAMMDESGYPYGVPLSYVYRDGCLYFHGAVNAGQKVKNLRANDKVCFTVVGDTKVMPEKFGATYESVIVFGRARELFAEEKQKALEAVISKYSADFFEGGLKYIAGAFEKTGVFEIAIDHMTGKAKV